MTFQTFVKKNVLKSFRKGLIEPFSKCTFNPLIRLGEVHYCFYPG